MVGMRVPGPIGMELDEVAIDPGTMPRIDMPPPGPIAIDLPKQEVAAKAAIDIDKAVKHLNGSAHSTSQGQCAKYVRLALAAGGAIMPQPNPHYAKEYGPVMEAIGFKVQSAENYLPQKGDVVVMEPPKGETAGHIQMYNGKIWVSDFTQRADMYPGPAYRRDKVPYVIYRP